MTVRVRRGSAPEEPSGKEPPRLTLRWFIIVIAGFAAYLVGASEYGAAGGLGAAASIVGLLHAILD